MPYNITESATGVFAFLPTPISISRWSIFAAKCEGVIRVRFQWFLLRDSPQWFRFFSLSRFSYLAIEFIVLVIVIFYCLPGKQANFCTSESSKTPRYPLPPQPPFQHPPKFKVSAAVEVEVGVGVVRYQFGSTFKAPSATGATLLYCSCRNMRLGYCKGGHGAGGVV